MSCPKCGGEAREPITRGFWRCTTPVATYLLGAAPGLPPGLQATAVQQQWVQCGEEYQEYDGSASPESAIKCGCGLYSIGQCPRCQTSYCGMHSRTIGRERLCDVCAEKEQQRLQEKAGQDRLAFYRRKIQPELDRFLEYLLQIEDPDQRFLAYAVNAPSVAAYGDPLQMWGAEGIFPAREATQQCIDIAVRPLFDGSTASLVQAISNHDSARSALEELSPEVVTRLLSGVTRLAPQRLAFGRYETRGFFKGMRWVETECIDAWEVHVGREHYYENNQDSPISGTHMTHYYLSRDYVAYRTSDRNNQPTKIGTWVSLLPYSWFSELLGVPPFPERVVG